MTLPEVRNRAGTAKAALNVSVANQTRVAMVHTERYEIAARTIAANRVAATTHSFAAIAEARIKAPKPATFTLGSSCCKAPRAPAERSANKARSIAEWR